jgi:hypothetical protein
MKSDEQMRVERERHNRRLIDGAATALTVAQFIAALSRLPPDAPVCFDYGGEPIWVHGCTEETWAGMGGVVRILPCGE